LQCERKVYFRGCFFGGQVMFEMVFRFIKWSGGTADSAKERRRLNL